MLKKRNRVFETNSSSTHCIVIAKEKDGNVTDHLPEKIEFGVGEFGWGFVRYDDIQSRANYLFTGLLCCLDTCNEADEAIGKIKNVLDKWNVEYEFPELEKVYSEYGKTYYYKVVGKEDYNYYVDHGYELDEWFKEVLDDETLLLNYLFSNESFVATGNDNSDDELDDETDAEVLNEYWKVN